LDEPVNRLECGASSPALTGVVVSPRDHQQTARCRTVRRDRRRLLPTQCVADAAALGPADKDARSAA
jgi:hypothetical protein